MTGEKSDFLRVFYLVSAAATICVAGYLRTRFGIDITLGVLIGGIFGIVNTVAIGKIISVWFDGAEIKKSRIFLSFLIKFPVIIGITALLFWQEWVSPVGFAIGFTVVLLSFPLSIPFERISSVFGRINEGTDRT